MILLDTNVLSEPSRPAPDSGVVSWLTRFDPLLFVPTIALAELQFGCARLQEGKRKRYVAESINNIQHQFAGRIVVFDIAAANEYGPMLAVSLAGGRPLGVPDAQIAAIALANRFELATRNVTDFAHLPLKLVNPWTA